jgi:hypothetical protein
MAKIDMAMVVFSVTLRNVEVPDDAEPWQQREILIGLAGSAQRASEAVIHDCSNSELID